MTLERLRMPPADNFGDAWKRIAFEENELQCERNLVIPGVDYQALERRCAVVLGSRMHATLEPVRVNYTTGRMSSRDFGPRPGRSLDMKLRDFGLTGGMALILAEETAPPDPPRAFKKGSFFPPESVAKSRNRLNKPPRGRRR